MATRNEVWKCDVCGIVTEVLRDGTGTLSCCGKPMILETEQFEEEKNEKHVPVIEGRRVKVGSVAHPMEAEHYIEWVEAVGDSGERAKIFLNPGGEPVAEFCFEVKSARAYCNVHGLWKN